MVAKISPSALRSTQKLKSSSIVVFSQDLKEVLENIQQEQEAQLDDSNPMR